MSPVAAKVMLVDSHHIIQGFQGAKGDEKKWSQIDNC
jgi:hypothetical protein